jgi:hypothetical protein
MLVACVALLVALSSTAVATLSVDSRAVKNNTLRSQDLRNGRAVRGVDVANDSLRGRDIKEASLAGATPVAFAYVLADGTVEAARSENLTSAKIVAEGSGTYCLRALEFEFKGAQVTVDEATSAAFLSGLFEIGNPSSACETPGTEAVVSIGGFAGGINGGFYILFYD